MPLEGQDLKERSIAFGIGVIRLADTMPRTPAGGHLSGQLVRPGTSAALNHGEARAGESHRDLTHKANMVLKELRGSWTDLRMIEGASLHGNTASVSALLKEGNELVPIFTALVRTAERRSPSRQ